MYPGQKYKQQYGNSSQNTGYPGSQQSNYRPSFPSPTPPQQYSQHPQQHSYPPPPNSTGGFAIPSAPTCGFTAPPGPPPSSGNYNYPPPAFQSSTGAYPPPSGPPPSTNGYLPPPGPPPPIDNNRNSISYLPPSGPPPPYYQYQSPAGPPPPPTSTPYQTPGRPPFNYQLSQCNGRKRALLIGINYFNTQHQLKGCINDVANIKSFLIELYGFRESDMVILTDNQTDPRNIPTRSNIIKAMHWLVHDARANDSFFFHYSGHGGQTEDLDGDEDDGYDETIMPVDFQTSGQIIDDEMHDIMVRPLPPGVRLTAIFDSCHSGTALDLPYIYSTHGVIKEPNLLAEGGNAILTAGMSYLKGDVSGIKTTLVSFGKKATKGNKVAEQNKQNKSSPADVIMLSGCKDAQTSADANEAGQNTGAMSYAFIKTLRANKNLSYQQLLVSIRDVLAGKYTQKPQLSSSHPMDMNLLFVM